MDTRLPIEENSTPIEVEAETEEIAKPPRRWPRIVLLTGGILLLLLALLTASGYFLNRKQIAAYASAHAAETAQDNSQQDFQSRRKRIDKKFAQIAPKGPYIIVDTGGNTLYLKKGSETIRQAVISCGSGNVLEDPNGDRKWVFDTPRGAFTVKSKATDPSWIKPDWAFIEDGENIPHDWGDRVEEGVLGDYALGIGQGYFIHGTLYTRLLGRNVTHGCIRVGDEDLEFIFKNVSIGTPVFII